MLYYISMETKTELVAETLRRLLQVARKLAYIETLPVPLGEGREVTTREAHIIQMIGEHHEMNITNLARSLGVTKSAASQMAARLAGKGHVEKQQAPYSNREYLLGLTESGREIYQAHRAYHGREMDELMDRLSVFSSAQVATLSFLLEAVDEIMDTRISRS